MDFSAFLGASEQNDDSLEIDMPPPPAHNQIARSNKIQKAVKPVLDRKPEKVIKKAKAKKDITVKIVGISTPETHEEHRANKRRYQTVVRYVIKGQFSNGKERVRQKVVTFGQKDGKYYIDHKDDDERVNSVTRMKKYTDPLSHKFWNLHFLNHPEILGKGSISVFSQIVSKYVGKWYQTRL